MLEKFNCKPEEIFYIGDEEKDIKGAKSVGIQSILINRDNKEKNFNQDFTVTTLTEVIDVIRSF